MIWYQELGFKENPFTIKPTHPHAYVGNQKTIEQITKSLTQGKICVVHGKYGAGKTTFLKTIISQFEGKRRVIYFSCNRLLQSLDIDKLLYERYLVTKWLKIRSKNMILLLDEANHLSEQDIQALYEYKKNGYLKSILFVTHHLDRLAIPKTMNRAVKQNTFAFDNSKTYTEIVRDRIGNHPLLPDPVIKAIYAKSSSMRHFLQNCDVFMRTMIAQKRKTAKIKDVSRITKVRCSKLSPP
ncbi:MAG: AAA family ATPase [Candidatus Woesearchaeota archaeon]